MAAAALIVVSGSRRCSVVVVVVAVVVFVVFVGDIVVHDADPVVVIIKDVVAVNMMVICYSCCRYGCSSGCLVACNDVRFVVYMRWPLRPAEE